jgi:hypothetical protein
VANDTQVNDAVDGVTETVGGVAFLVTDAVAVAVQPLLPVTVTVYVPALLAVIAAVVAPVLQV